MPGFNYIVPTSHALKRAFQRSISIADMQHVLATGIVLENYLHDTPFPSYLVLGWANARPIHIVAADNVTAQETIIVTVYEPDPVLWSADFRRRQ